MSLPSEQENRATNTFVGQCPCGECVLEIEQMPSVRFLCHCNICQSVYPGDYADATVIRADKVKVKTPENIVYKQLKEPPALNRGICKSCNHPVVGFMKGQRSPELAFLPSAVLPERADKPRPLRHVFYETRVADINDSLPKTSGTFKSQMSLMLPFIRVLRGG